MLQNLQKFPNNLMKKLRLKTETHKRLYIYKRLIFNENYTKVFVKIIYKLLRKPTSQSDKRFCHRLI